MDDDIEDPRALDQRVRRRLNDLISRKYGDDEMLGTVGEMGLERSRAVVMLKEVKNQRVADKRKAAMRGMIIGAVLLTGGVAASTAVWIAMGMTAGLGRITWLAVSLGASLIVTNYLAHSNAKP